MQDIRSYICKILKKIILLLKCIEKRDKRLYKIVPQVSKWRYCEHISIDIKTKIGW